MAADKDTWDFNKIIDYFENKLSDKEVQEIDQLIAEDKGFAAMIDDLYDGWLNDPGSYREKVGNIQQSMYQHLEKSIPENTSNEEKSVSDPIPINNGRRRVLYTVISVAAIFTILIIATRNIWSNSCPIDDYACLIEEMGGLYAEKISGASIGHSAEVIDAVSAYKEGDYVSAIYKIRSLPEDDLSLFERDELNLCLGISYLMEKQFLQALTYFDVLIKNNSGYYVTEAKWYSALIYLHRKNYDAARPFLQELSETNNTYQVKAKALLKRVGKK